MPAVSLSQPMRSLSLILLLALSCFMSASAQKAATDTPPPGSISLQTATVARCITAEAVLLPRDPAAKLFSDFVARNYAVVKTTISNHCDQQQFILHNIYFDYSDWALSGVYKQPAGSESCPASGKTQKPETCNGKDCASTTNAPAKTSDCCQNAALSCETDDFTQGTKPGQVATVGALDLQDQVTEDSVFSKRNLVVNGLTLVGQVAGGYAFVGSAAAAQGIGAFSSAFVPNLGKFWPDRRLDQEQFLLKLGYRTDQSTAIAKDDHGSYYAFFPLSTFLIPDLKKLFLKDPAFFLNPAEAWLEPGALEDDSQNTKKHNRHDDLAWVRSYMWQLAQAVDGKEKLTRAQLLVYLGAKCNETECAVCLPGGDKDCPAIVKAEKELFQKASLNSVKIVVRGVMTVDLDDVPPIINTITFDSEKLAATWTVASPTTGADAGASTTAASDTASESASKPAPAPKAPVKTIAGTATGKFLSNATLALVSAKGPAPQPGAEQPDLMGSIDKTATKIDNSRSTDTTIAFSIGITSTLPSGTELTFQPTRTTPNTSNGTSIQATGSNFVYKVSYEAPAVQGDPSIDDVKMDNELKVAIWNTPDKLPGTVTGKNLVGASVSVTAIKIGGKAVSSVSDYVGTATTQPGSDASTLKFILPLLKAIPAGSEVSFVASPKAGDKGSPSKPKVYTVPPVNAAKTKPAAKKLPSAKKSK